MLNRFNGIEKTINSIVQETSSIHGITTITGFATTTTSSTTSTSATTKTTTTTAPPATTAMMTTKEVTEIDSRPAVFEGTVCASFFRNASFPGGDCGQFLDFFLPP